MNIFNRNKKKIIFSEKPEWQKNIKKKLKKDFQVDFLDLHNVSIDTLDLLIPMEIEDIEYTLENFPEMNMKNYILPNRKSLNICDDKLLFNKFMKENGFSKYIPKINDNLNFPYIVKKRIDAFGENSFIINNKLDKKRYKSEIRNTEEYFCQEMVAGKEEYTCHILFHNGKVKFDLSYEFSFTEEYYIKGKKAIASENNRKVVDSKYLDLFSEILSKLHFQGLCCFNYKIKNGMPKIFEINPRYGGSLTPCINEVVKVHLDILKNN